MAFIVEDGTGVKGATSYGTLAAFKLYFADRIEDVTGIADADIQLALVAATDYLDDVFGNRFKGQREFNSLNSRSVLTLNGALSDGETVVFGSETYTFRNTASGTNEVEISANLFTSLNNLVAKILEVDALVTTPVFLGSRFADADIAAITLYANVDAVTTTETLSNGSFDLTETAGLSNKKQPVEFPRKNAFDNSNPRLQIIGVPEALKEATYEYARRANALTELSPDPTIDESGQALTLNREKVGPVETEVRYESNPVVKVTKDYPKADRLLKGLLVSGGGVIRS